MATDPSNKTVRAALAARPSIDRFAQTIEGVLEWVVSLDYRIRGDNPMNIRISIDLVDINGETSVAMVIGEYATSDFESADADGRIVASKYCITYRVRDLSYGWREVAIGLTPPLHPDNWRQP